jgi:hypothetical protein
MTGSRSGPNRNHLASSPFQPEPEQVIETFELQDRVSHDTYGVGRVVDKEHAAVTVDFGTRTCRILSPYPKLEKL